MSRRWPKSMGSESPFTFGKWLLTTSAIPAKRTESTHNHLIFNAVSFTDHKHYHTNERSYHEIHRISSWLSREYKMSVSVLKRDTDKSCINKTVHKLKIVFGQHKASKDKGKLLWRLSKIILLGVTRGNKVVEFIKLPSTEKPKAELAGLIAHKAILQVELHKIH